jgi:predicted nucleic acid-binding protein
MIGIDASVAIPWFEGADYPEVRLLGELILNNTAVYPAVVVTEVLSGPKVSSALTAVFPDAVILPIEPGYWIRAGQLRSRIKSLGRRARLADTLVAQACLDADIPLLARDSDFDVFVEVAGLRLVQP